MGKMRFVPVLALLAAAAACGRERDTRTGGAALFGATCARCHAADGRGDPTAKATLGVPDMTDPAWQARLTDEDIRRTVREGSRSKKMPPFGALYSAAQLEALVAHVRGLARAR
jgi:mono/diheme cytochrome c family protein